MYIYTYNFIYGFTLKSGVSIFLCCSFSGNVGKTKEKDGKGTKRKDYAALGCYQKYSGHDHRMPTLENLIPFECKKLLFSR